MPPAALPGRFHVRSYTRGHLTLTSPLRPAAFLKRQNLHHVGRISFGARRPNHEAGRERAVSFPFALPRLSLTAAGQTQGITFREPAAAVEVYDFAEVTISVQELQAANPFTDAAVVGEFRRDGGEPIRVGGFCDAADGSLFRIRFMPSEPGRYDYTITCRWGTEETLHSGSFSAVASRRRGILRVDAEYPEHFVWQGTGEHYFWNGTTTYYLMGWDDETIRRSIDRLG